MGNYCSERVRWWNGVIVQWFKGQEFNFSNFAADNINMKNLRDTTLDDFSKIEQRQTTSSIHSGFTSHYKPKPGSYVIPRTEHTITKMPEGIL